MTAAGRPTRAELGGVALLTVLMFAMSAVVALRQPIWSPIDEAAHYATAVGAIHLHYPRINRPIFIPHDLPFLGASGQDYQAGGPPLNYLLLGVVEEVARALASGFTHAPDRVAVRAMRLSESFLLACLIPLLWLCARRIAPGDLAFAWGMPGAAFLFRGVIIDGSRVSNDVLVAVLATLAVLLFLHWRDGLTAGRGLVLGVLIGLATVSKISGVYAFIPIGLLLLTRPPAIRRAISAAAAAVAAWIVLVTPWFAFQYHRYGDPTGASVVKSVLPHPVWLPPNPWPAILSSPYDVYLSATLAEVANPLHDHLVELNRLVQWVTPWLLVLGVLAAVFAFRREGLDRLGRIALAVAAPAMFALLAVLSVKAGYSFLGDARDELPAIMPFCFLGAAPLLLPRRPLPGLVAGGVLALWSCLALLSTVLLALPWPS